MKAPAESRMHVEHREWKSDVRMWRDDIAAWKKEQAKCFAELERAIAAEIEGINGHQSAIFRHQELVRNHEHTIATVQKPSKRGPNEITARMANSHKREAQKHDLMCSAHERLKQHHHAVVGRLNAILKMLKREV